MIALPDVNVLIALAWPNHVHHDAARSWFATNRSLPQSRQQSELVIPV